MIIDKVEEFELSCREIGGEFDLSPFRDDTRAQFLYEGAFQFPCIRVYGSFRVLKNEYRGVSFYQLEIDAELEFFNNLKKRAEKLCGRDNVIIGDSNSFDPYKPDRAD